MRWTTFFIVCVGPSFYYMRWATFSLIFHELIFVDFADVRWIWRHGDTGDPWCYFDATAQMYREQMCCEPQHEVWMFRFLVFFDAKRQRLYTKFMLLFYQEPPAGRLCGQLHDTFAKEPLCGSTSLSIFDFLARTKLRDDFVANLIPFCWENSAKTIRNPSRTLDFSEAFPRAPKNQLKLRRGGRLRKPGQSVSF